MSRRHRSGGQRSSRISPFSSSRSALARLVEAGWLRWLRWLCFRYPDPPSEVFVIYKGGSVGGKTHPPKPPKPPTRLGTVNGPDGLTVQDLCDEALPVADLVSVFGEQRPELSASRLAVPGRLDEIAERVAHAQGRCVVPPIRSVNQLLGRHVAFCGQFGHTSEELTDRLLVRVRDRGLTQLPDVVP